GGGRALRTWDNLLLGRRSGEDGRIVATTTPRAVPLVQRLMAEAESGEVAITRGSTYDNAANLPARFIRAMHRQFGTGAFARQELGGEMLEDVEGALWSRAMLEQCRAGGPGEPPVRIAV